LPKRCGKNIKNNNPKQENRINVERRNFNVAAQNFNTKIRRFPTSILANLFGFDKKPYFEAEAGSETAPNVQL